MKIIASKISLFLIMLFLFSLIGCNNQGKVFQNTQDEPVNATLVMASPTGTLSMVMNGVAECVNKSYPGSVISIIPGAGGANIYRINNHEVDGGHTHSVLAYAAMHGQEPYNEKLANIAAIAGLYHSNQQFIIRKDLGIKSFDEIIEGKLKLRISVDQKGSMCPLAFSRLLAEYGFTIDDFNAWGGEVMYYNMNDSCSMMSDGLIDAALLSTFLPTPPIQEMSMNTQITILEIGPNVIEALVNKYGYEKIIIPQDTYSFLNKDMLSFASRIILIVPSDSTDDLPYKLAKSITENLDYLKSIHSGLSEMNTSFMTQHLGIPLHSGAEKYYKEAGILK